MPDGRTVERFRMTARTATNRPTPVGRLGTGAAPEQDPAGTAPGPERLRVLLVEDDADDAFLVRELLTEVRAPVDVDVAATMAEARQRLTGIDCVLLDLGLPDATGRTGLRQVLSAADGVAVCVLTGLEDEHL